MWTLVTVLYVIGMFVLFAVWRIAQSRAVRRETKWQAAARPSPAERERAEAIRRKAEQAAQEARRKAWREANSEIVRAAVAEITPRISGPGPRQQASPDNTRPHHNNPARIRSSGFEHRH